MIINAYQGLTRTCTITMTDANGNLSVESGDELWLKIGQPGRTLLSIRSSTATANGSSLSHANPTTLRLDGKDLDSIATGTYDVELTVVDDSDADDPVHIQDGAITIHPSQTNQ